MFRKPAIPERTSSLLRQIPYNETTTLLRKRSASALSILDSKNDRKSTATDFVDAKVDSLEADLQLQKHLKAQFLEAYKNGDLNRTMFEEAMKEVEDVIEDITRCLHVSKREKKTLIDDMNDSLRHTINSSKMNLAHAFVGAVASKVANATGDQKKKKFSRENFCKGVCEYYDAKRILISDTGEETEQKWCHVEGWQEADDVRCAHLVPKSLETEELARFFGAEQTTLMEARNGLTLSKNIEKGIDNCRIVFVPEIDERSREIKWKIVLTNKWWRNQTLVGNEKWQDIEGKFLQFRTENRPARRYLYFRYVMTLIALRREQKKSDIKEKDLSSWEEEVKAKGIFWATPDPEALANKTMLMVAAEVSGDFLLPEVFYKDSTFISHVSAPTMDAVEEQRSGTELGLQIRRHLMEREKIKSSTSRQE